MKKLNVQIFNAKELGGSLQEVASENIQTENQDIESRWFHSIKDADLFIWRDQQKNIIKQQVTYFGQLVEWNVIEGVRTGLLIEDETSQKISSSPLIQYDQSPQVHAIKQCIEMIAYVPALSDEDKKQLVHNFTTSPTFSNQSPEELLKRYGRKNGDQARSLPLGFNQGSFLSRIWQWLSQFFQKNTRN